MSDEARKNTTRSYGALPPEDSGWQIGDRADKPCVMAAQKVLRDAGLDASYEATQKAVDTYLAEAEKRGWKLR